ncbi:MAG TPA: HAMP domain-containing protein [Roseiflexaceae bacterium]|nr:HAMP domain-containing protein [Roseiflexaceae bacterium]
MTASQQRRSRVIYSFPSREYFANLGIGPKLAIGFGLMILLTLLVIGVSYLSSVNATASIERTNRVRVPITLAASSAQANLLRMLASTRGYLALGEPEFRNSYLIENTALQQDLAQLNRLAQLYDLEEDDRARLREIEARFAEWRPLPAQLFALRDDQLEREPAYKILATDGISYGGRVLINTQRLIALQASQPATTESLSALRSMATFQGTFASMVSGLRGYVTTRNRIFRSEYDSNRDFNEIAWFQMNESAALFTPDQQKILAAIEADRAEFLKLPDQMFAALEGAQWREDLYLFKTQALPIGDDMSRLLKEMTDSQQNRLSTELSAGRAGLERANDQTRIGGLIALILGVGMAWFFTLNITGPVRRLTAVAERVEAGNLDARAQIETHDEIGVLSETFNSMTAQIQQNVVQIRREKKRADDLLIVVIPIGVALSDEKDFNRLLETMLVEAKTFCRARAGTLYLRTEDDKLQFVILRNDQQQLALGGTTGQKIPYDSLPMYQPEGVPNDRYIATYVALNGVSVNLPSIHEGVGLRYDGPREFQSEYGYESTSFLTIPLKNTSGEVRGVLQLIDAEDAESGQVIPFDPNLQQMMESFSSLAVAALEAYSREQALRQEIRQLHIVIDESKRQKEVQQIVDTDFFQTLQAKGRSMRNRRFSSEAAARGEGEPPEAQPEDSVPQSDTNPAEDAE